MSSDLVQRYDAVQDSIEERLAEQGTMGLRYTCAMEKVLIRIHELATEDLPTWNSYELATKLELIQRITSPWVKGIEETVEDLEDS